MISSILRLQGRANRGNYSGSKMEMTKSIMVECVGCRRHGFRDKGKVKVRDWVGGLLLCERCAISIDEGVSTEFVKVHVSRRHRCPKDNSGRAGGGAKRCPSGPADGPLDKGNRIS